MKNILKNFRKMTNIPKKYYIFALRTYKYKKKCNSKVTRDLEASVRVKVPRCFFAYCILKMFAATCLLFLILTIYIMRTEIERQGSVSINEQVSAVSAASVSTPCPISKELLNAIGQLGDLRQFFENKYEDDDDLGIVCELTNNLFLAVDGITKLIALELEGALFFKEKEERSVA